MGPPLAGITCGGPPFHQLQAARQGAQGQEARCQEGQDPQEGRQARSQEGRRQEARQEVNNLLLCAKSFRALATKHPALFRAKTLSNLKD